MSNKYVPVIGLEIHIQSKTESKMFCSCSSKYFATQPNSNVCEVCLGLPGALPVPNKKAIENCVLLSFGLNCQINKYSKFDRKHYYYPDLPKGYQISQYDLPFGIDGFLEVQGGETPDDKTRIRIKRVHQEEDTAKSIHISEGSMIDYNKSGVALIEVVTEPDFVNTNQVLEFAKKLQRIVRYLGVSDANMEMGQMRFELNISVKPENMKGYPDYKVECKNISSISILEKVINHEIKRQTEILEKGEKPIQATLGIDDNTGETFVQRVKEDAEDYRYFQEPDIPPIVIDDKWMTEICSRLIELPEQKSLRFSKDYQIAPESIELIIEDKFIADLYEQTVKECVNSHSSVDKIEYSKQVANFLVGEIFALVKKSDYKVNEIKISAFEFAEIIVELMKNNISGATVKLLLAEFLFGNNSNISVKDYIISHDLSQISDEVMISEVIEKVLLNNEKVVADYKNGKLNAKSSLIGLTMREFKGKANPKIIDELMSKKLT